MNKEKFLKLLVGQLKRLEEVEHISELAENGQYEEVDAVIAEIDYNSFDEYMESEEFEVLDISDIPKQYILTFAIYLAGSEYDEFNVMKEWTELHAELEKCGDVGKKIVEYIFIDGCDTFAELMEVDDDDYEDELEDEPQEEFCKEESEEADKDDEEEPAIDLEK